MGKDIININVALNETLSKFLQAAYRHNAGDNMRVTGSDGIRTGQHDLGKLSRLFKLPSSADQIRENNEIRTQLLNALSEQFGGGLQIPDSVKKALYGSSVLGKSDMSMDAGVMVNSGRPLTVRRVKAVLSAVVSYLAQESLEKMGGVKDEPQNIEQPKVEVKNNIGQPKVEVKKNQAKVEVNDHGFVKVDKDAIEQEMQLESQNVVTQKKEQPVVQNNGNVVKQQPKIATYTSEEVGKMNLGDETVDEFLGGRCNDDPEKLAAHKKYFLQCMNECGDVQKARDKYMENSGNIPLLKKEEKKEAVLTVKAKDKKAANFEIKRAANFEIKKAESFEIKKAEEPEINSARDKILSKIENNENDDIDQSNKGFPREEIDEESLEFDIIENDALNGGKIDNKDDVDSIVEEPQLQQLDDDEDVAELTTINGFIDDAFNENKVSKSLNMTANEIELNGVRDDLKMLPEEQSKNNKSVILNNRKGVFGGTDKLSHKADNNVKEPHVLTPEEEYEAKLTEKGKKLTTDVLYRALMEIEEEEEAENRTVNDGVDQRPESNNPSDDAKINKPHEELKRPSRPINDVVLEDIRKNLEMTGQDRLKMAIDERQDLSFNADHSRFDLPDDDRLSRTVLDDDDMPNPYGEDEINENKENEVNGASSKNIDIAKFSIFKATGNQVNSTEVKEKPTEVKEPLLEEDDDYDPYGENEINENKEQKVEGTQVNSNEVKDPLLEEDDDYNPYSDDLIDENEINSHAQPQSDPLLNMPEGWSTKSENKVENATRTSIDSFARTLSQETCQGISEYIKNHPRAGALSGQWIDAYSHQILADLEKDLDVYIGNMGINFGDGEQAKFIQLLKGDISSNARIQSELAGTLNLVLTGENPNVPRLGELVHIALTLKIGDLAERFIWSLHNTDNKAHSAEVSNVHSVQPGKMDFKEGAIYGQSSGGNMCPIISTINSLLLVGGPATELVRDALTPKTDGNHKTYYEFPYMVEVNNQMQKLCVTEQDIAMYFSPKSTFLEIEKIMFTALRKANCLDTRYKPGDTFDVMAAMKIFNMSPKQMGRPQGQGALSMTELCDYGVQVAQALVDGLPCVLGIPGHYMAIDGVTFDQSGIPTFSVIESSTTNGVPSTDKYTSNVLMTLQSVQFYTGI